MPLTLLEAAKLRQANSTPGRSNPMTRLRPVPKSPPAAPPMSPVQQVRRIPKVPSGKR